MTYRNETVLLVGDEPLLRLAAADWLADDGFVTIEAGGSAEALALLDAHPEVSVLVTDIQMPGGDGLELAREVHARRPDIQLIVTSGRLHPGPDEIPDDGRFLAKPYGPHAVRDLLKAMN